MPSLEAQLQAHLSADRMHSLNKLIERSSKATFTDQKSVTVAAPPPTTSSSGVTQLSPISTISSSASSNASSSSPSQFNPLIYNAYFQLQNIINNSNSQRNSEISPQEQQQMEMLRLLMIAGTRADCGRTTGAAVAAADHSKQHFRTEAEKSRKLEQNKPPHSATSYSLTSSIGSEHESVPTASSSDTSSPSASVSSSSTNLFLHSSNTNANRNNMGGASPMFSAVAAAAATSGAKTAANFSFEAGSPLIKPEFGEGAGNNEMLVPSNDKEGWCRNKKYIQIVPRGYRCTVCNKIYGRYNSVSYHVTIYHRNPPIRCEEDGCQFTTREARYIHFHKYYRHQIPLPESIDLASRKCPLLRCKHVSKSPAMLEKHLQRHVADCLRDGVYECSDCCSSSADGDTSFRSASYETMFEHFRQVHAVGSFESGNGDATAAAASPDSAIFADEKASPSSISDIAADPKRLKTASARKSPLNFSCDCCSYRGRTLSNLEQHKLVKHCDTRRGSLKENEQQQLHYNQQQQQEEKLKKAAGLAATTLQSMLTAGQMITNDVVMDDLTVSPNMLYNNNNSCFIFPQQQKLYELQQQQIQLQQLANGMFTSELPTTTITPTSGTTTTDVVANLLNNFNLSSILRNNSNPSSTTIFNNSNGFIGISNSFFSSPFSESNFGQHLTNFGLPNVNNNNINANNNFNFIQQQLAAAAAAVAASSPQLPQPPSNTSHLLQAMQQLLADQKALCIANTTAQ